MNPEIEKYVESQAGQDQEIGRILTRIIDRALSDAESKIWHKHPVWFLSGNPIVGFSKQKEGVRLMFWSGADFDEPALSVLGGKFKDASVFYRQPSEVDENQVVRWLKKSREIQWDYQNLVKRKGKLVRLKPD